MDYNLKSRKLIQFSHSYLLTVPKVWLDNHKLGKGSHVSVRLSEDGSLIIMPAGEDNVQN